MYRVSKVLNNNGVIAIDMDENQEYVIDLYNMYGLRRKSSGRRTGRARKEGGCRRDPAAFIFLPSLRLTKKMVR